MTPRSEAIIERLLQEPKNNDTPESVAYSLCLLGFSPTEIGWVLRHVFQLRMQEGVHIALSTG